MSMSGFESVREAIVNFGVATTGYRREFGNIMIA